MGIVHLKEMAGVLLLSAISISNVWAGLEVEAGPYFKNVKYTEFSRRGDFLDSDKGDLWGAQCIRSFAGSSLGRRPGPGDG